MNITVVAILFLIATDHFHNPWVGGLYTLFVQIVPLTLAWVERRAGGV